MTAAQQVSRELPDDHSSPEKAFLNFFLSHREQQDNFLIIGFGRFIHDRSGRQN